MFLKLLAISLVLVSLAVLGLGLNILLRKNGKFPVTSVGHNPEMKKRGLSCAKQEEIRMWKKQIATPGAVSGSTPGGCTGCNCADQ